ncbi:hypothetical protein GGI08_003831 [Coemansia sp. S2]|nr:hypothetical protein GGI08_003831 [Coemansia sp. S2]
MDAPLLAILNKSNAFNRTSYPNMRLLTLVHDLNETNRPDHSKFISYASRVACSRTALELHAINYIDRFVDNFLQGTPIQGIQNLNFDRAKVSLDSLFSLIRLLPRMTQLSFGYLVFDEHYLGVSTNDIYNQVSSKWRTLSKCLQYCHISSYEKHSTDNLATCGILLAILCPRFTRLVVHGMLQSEFNQSISCALEEEPFARYGDRLKRLAFKDTLEVN